MVIQELLVSLLSSESGKVWFDEFRGQDCFFNSMLYLSQELDPSDDFSPGLAFLVVVGLAFSLCCIGAGIVITLFVLALVLGLIGAGVLSVSVLVGLNKKSFRSGFKTFLIISSIVGGALTMMTGFYLLNNYMEWWGSGTSLVIGLLCGVSSGYIFGYIVFWILQKVTTTFLSLLHSK